VLTQLRVCRLAPAAPSHRSPQLQAFFQETPRASDPEAIFADHTPASGELASQVTQLNPDVAPEVNVELVLSQVLALTPHLAGGHVVTLGRNLNSLRVVERDV
jgi:hypothetical protein